jgi:hypothetical protein
MLFEEYIWLLATEEHYQEPTDSLKQIAIKKFTDQFVNEKVNIEKGIREETKSTKNASIAPGKFPIVIYAPGQNGSAFENTVIL